MFVIYFCVHSHFGYIFLIFLMCGFRPVSPWHRFFGGLRFRSEEDEGRRGRIWRPAGHREGPDVRLGDVMHRQRPWIGLTKI